MVSMGAMGDSYYEYLLKVWIYKGRRKEDDMYRGEPDCPPCHLRGCTSLTGKVAGRQHLLSDAMSDWAACSTVMRAQGMLRVKEAACLCGDAIGEGAITRKRADITELLSRDVGAVYG